MASETMPIPRIKIEIRISMSVIPERARRDVAFRIIVRDLPWPLAGAGCRAGSHRPRADVENGAVADQDLAGAGEKREEPDLPLEGRHEGCSQRAGRRRSRSGRMFDPSGIGR